MSSAHCSSFHVNVLALACTAAITVAFAPTPVAAQDMPDTMRGDRGREGGVRGGPGIGLGIGLGIGVMEELTHRQDTETRPTKDTKAARRAEEKNARRAARKQDKPEPKTTDKPPGQKTTDKPPEPKTVDSPPQPNTTDKPAVPKTTDTPPVAPPTAANPQPVSPPLQPTVQNEDCPQRGKGCVALIIDFLTDSSIQPDLKPLSDHLKQNNGCAVDYVTPQIKPLPEGTYTYEPQGQPDVFVRVHHPPDPKEVDAVRDSNKQQWDNVFSAIDKHRERLKAGTELAIEVLLGHGTSTESAARCGQVGPGEGRSLSRESFHTGNYDAANKNTCGWFVADLSCSSGLTPFIVDQLNNEGLATVIDNDVDPKGTVTPTPRKHGCIPQGPQVPDTVCPNHAAYDFDVAVGVANADSGACGFFTPARRDAIADALPNIGGTITFTPPTDFLDRRASDYSISGLEHWVIGGEEHFGSHYADKGYKHCGTPLRFGYNKKLKSEAEKDFEAREERKRYEELHRAPGPAEPDHGGSTRGTTR
ncbi:MAG: hypothetical protein ACLP1D_08565 [Xanthobacteraceae bacterium]